MPVSGLINNCGFNFAIPDVLGVFKKLEDSSFDTTYKSEYEKLKAMFCEFYGLKNENTTFAQLHQFISTKSSGTGTETRPFFEQELILGPVLRNYFLSNINSIEHQTKIDLSSANIQKIQDQDDKVQWQSQLGVIADIGEQASPDLNLQKGRYEQVDPVLLNWHLYSKLGIDIDLKAKDEYTAPFNQFKFDVQDPVARTTQYYNGSHYEFEMKDFTADKNYEGVVLQLSNANSQIDAVRRILDEFKDKTSAELKEFINAKTSEVSSPASADINDDDDDTLFEVTDGVVKELEVHNLMSVTNSETAPELESTISPLRFNIKPKDASAQITETKIPIISPPSAQNSPQNVKNLPDKVESAYQSFLQASYNNEEALSTFRTAIQAYNIKNEPNIDWRDIKDTRFVLELREQLTKLAKQNVAPDNIEDRLNGIFPTTGSGSLTAQQQQLKTAEIDKYRNSIYNQHVESYRAAVKAGTDENQAFATFEQNTPPSENLSRDTTSSLMKVYAHHIISESMKNFPTNLDTAEEMTFKKNRIDEIKNYSSKFSTQPIPTDELRQINHFFDQKITEAKTEAKAAEEAVQKRAADAAAQKTVEDLKGRFKTAYDAYNNFVQSQPLYTSVLTLKLSPEYQTYMKLKDQLLNQAEGDVQRKLGTYINVLEETAFEARLKKMTEYMDLFLKDTKRRVDQTPDKESAEYIVKEMQKRLSYQKDEQLRLLAEMFPFCNIDTNHEYMKEFEKTKIAMWHLASERHPPKPTSLFSKRPTTDETHLNLLKNFYDTSIPNGDVGRLGIEAHQDAFKSSEVAFNKKHKKPGDEYKISIDAVKKEYDEHKSKFVTFYERLVSKLQEFDKESNPPPPQDIQNLKKIQLEAYKLYDVCFSIGLGFNHYDQFKSLAQLHGTFSKIREERVNLSDKISSEPETVVNHPQPKTPFLNEQVLNHFEQAFSKIKNEWEQKNIATLQPFAMEIKGTLNQQQNAELESLANKFIDSHTGMESEKEIIKNILKENLAKMLNDVIVIKAFEIYQNGKDITPNDSIETFVRTLKSLGVTDLSALSKDQQIEIASASFKNLSENYLESTKMKSVASADPVSTQSKQEFDYKKKLKAYEEFIESKALFDSIDTSQLDPSIKEKMAYVEGNHQMFVELKLLQENLQRATSTKDVLAIDLDSIKRRIINAAKGASASDIQILTTKIDDHIKTMSRERLTEVSAQSQPRPQSPAAHQPSVATKLGVENLGANGFNTINSLQGKSPLSQSGASDNSNSGLKSPNAEESLSRAETPLLSRTQDYKSQLAEAKAKIKVGNQDYYKLQSTEGSTIAKLKEKGIEGFKTKTEVGNQDEGIQKRVCNVAMHMIEEVLAKGGAVNITTKDPFVKEFTAYYLSHLKNSGIEFKSNLLKDEAHEINTQFEQIISARKPQHLQTCLEIRKKTLAEKGPGSATLASVSSLKPQ